MENNTPIEVDVILQIENMDYIEELNRKLLPDVSTLAAQIRKLLKDIETVARAMLLKQYANKMIIHATSSNYFVDAAKVHVIIKFNNEGITSFSGNMIILSIQGITETRLFDWKIIDDTKAKLALNVLNYFDTTEKEPVTLNGIPIPFK